MSAAVLHASKQPTERSGSLRSVPRGMVRGRADDDVSTSEYTISFPMSSSTSTPTQVSISSETSSATCSVLELSSLPTTASTSQISATATASTSQISATATVSTSTSQRTLAANVPGSSVSTSGIVPIFGPITGTIEGVFTPVTNAKSTSSIYGGPVADPSIGPSSAAATFASLSSLDSGYSVESSAVASSISTTTFSLKLFPPQFPTPHSILSSPSDKSHSVSFSSSKTDPSRSGLRSGDPSNSVGSAATNGASSGSVVPTAAPTSRPSGGPGGSAIDQEPSNTISFTMGPSVGSTTTGGSTTTPVFATSNSLSRTFAHNTGGIVGVALGAVIALVLGILLTFCACRHLKKSPPKRKISGMWISPPLLQGNDGLDDAYSPVARRRSRRQSPSFIRPLSFQSLDNSPPVDPEMAADGLDSDAHYDTDTWGSAGAVSLPPPPPAAPVMSNSPSPLSPEFYAPSTPSPPPQQSTPIISAKGFMRRLRRGRPSMASRGLLTTLAPVIESPYSPGPSSVAEISRPPSSLHGALHGPALVSRQTPPAPPVPVPVPQNFSLPWIHRTRGTPPTTETPGVQQTEWTPPATWAI
ncbi:hypothetical protein B0H19DRAFT_1098321 [Mycena capillaripes]|nr:hypothetical protein B0H19DRAFT_1098321 [Mycena capillaripes]